MKRNLLSRIRQNYMSTSLRFQLARLSHVVANCESEEYDYDYMTTSLRDIEMNLRRIRQGHMDN